MERCPCGPDTQHIRWFLQGEGEIVGARFPQEAVLAKEWETDAEFWWWFGRRIALSDLRTGRIRLIDAFQNDRKNPPKRLFYEGRLYHQVPTNDSASTGDEESAPMTVWEYVDAEEAESILLEVSINGEAVAYHGAYYDPELIKTT